MKRLKLFSLLSVLIIVLASVLLKVEVAVAAPVAKCGSWRVVSSPNKGSHLLGDALEAVAMLSSNDVWAVGSYATGNIRNSIAYTLTEHWDGSKWSIIASPNPSRFGSALLSVAAVSANDAWAVGYYHTQSGDSIAEKNLIEHWDGSTWSIISSPNPSLYHDNLFGVTAVSANDVWAVGGYYTPGVKSGSLVEHWDGSAWKVISTPKTNSGFQAVTHVPGTHELWAVGFYSPSRFGPSQGLIEHWDGSKWSVVASPDPGAYANILASVTATATNDAWAVGYYAYQSGQFVYYETLVEHWDGTKWSFVKSPSNAFSNTLTGVVAVSANNAWAVGVYIPYIYDPWMALIRHWDGKKWSSVSSPDPSQRGNVLFGVASSPGTNEVWTVGYYYASRNNDAIHTLTEFYC